jgi:citrate synthase
MSEEGQPTTSGAGKTFLSSSEVVERLGISKSTLYAYVSRGLIRSAPDPSSPRSRRYRADDVERLLNRQRMRSDPEHAASGALTWGSPVMESSVSMIADGHLYYRNNDAVSLARTSSFEEIVALLWLNDHSAPLPEMDRDRATLRNELIQQSSALARTLDAPSRVQMLLPVMEQRDPASYDFRPEALHRVGMDILQLFTASLAGAEGHSGFARTLQAYWAPGHPEIARLIDSALVLSADHELNISTFTVRCVASSRAPLHSAIAAGFSAMRGQKHGGATLQAAALFNEVQSPDRAYEVLRSRVQRGESLAGFGHRLYPEGDPRGQALLEALRHELSGSEAIDTADAIADAALKLQGALPNLDFGLVTLSRAIGQPPETALALMAFGRVAGWVAHAREEYDRDQLIRPRARYTSADETRGSTSGAAAEAAGDHPAADDHSGIPG